MPATPGHGGDRSAASVGPDAVALVAAKAGRTVSVCIPARNEGATIGPIVRTIVTELTAAGGGVPLVDDVLVVGGAVVDDE